MSTLAQRRTAAAAAIAMLFAILQYVMFTVSPFAAGATHVEPIFIEGNQNCASATGLTEAGNRVEPVRSGTYDVATADGRNYTIVLTVHGNATFDFAVTAGDGPIAAVFVKGGTDGNLYDYRPAGSLGDTGLHAPVNPSNGQFYGLSHVTFCVDDEPTTTTTEGTTTTTEGTTTTTEGSTTTTEGSTTTTEGSTTTTQGSTTTTQGSTTTTQGSTTPTAAPLGALGDYVWVDSNPDCTQGATELPLAGVQVDLFDDGVLVASTFTDANGGYLFEDLPASSTYQVRFTLTDTAELDYSFTPCDGTVPDDVDSDAVPQADTNVGVTSFINLPAGVTDRTWDAGVVFTNVQGIQIESTTTTIEPVTVGTLPFTGVDLEDLVWLATGVLAAGLAVLFQMGRRDTAANRQTISGWSNNR